MTLDELSREGVVRSLSHAEAAALAGTKLVEVRPEGGQSWKLLPAGNVGATRVGDKQIQVLPKGRVGVAHLLFLLGYARNPGFREEYVLGVHDDDLWPALAESLARQTERALTHGVLQGYRTTDDSLRTVRGRIRIGDQLSLRQGQLLPIEVTHDEFTVDTVENRILRGALRRMLAVPRVDPEVRRRLVHLDARLEGVAFLRAGEDAPVGPHPPERPLSAGAAARGDRAAQRVGAAGAGEVPVASFVVSMAKVYEDFVTTALTEALRETPGRTEAQHRVWLDEPGPGRRHGAIRMDVDVVHLDRDGRPQVVYDAKYKAASPKGEYPNADHYQMLAYCTALEVPVAWLVYAQGVASPAPRRVRHTGITVVEYPLDLSARPRVVLEQVADLARLSVEAFPMPLSMWRRPARASTSLVVRG
ncbi:McrC family protein [Ornithinimicrobium flavum]|uniref:McrC family protein n=1 Tax=Ornithinimicrobium flavum TaxID=1288636 RepID=UPI001EE96D2F|nr:McrC family protein [Ornithinimicrobium flavum]